MTLASSNITVGLDTVVPTILQIGFLRAPQEACGIVVPDLEVPASRWVHELVNRSSSPDSSYEIDPETIRGLIGDANEEHFWSNVLIWHTHPSGHVGPSKQDVLQKHPMLRYLVVAMPRGEATLF